MLKSDDPLIFLRSLYDAAVAAAQPDKVMPRFMPQPPENGRVFVIGAGKASAQMAQAFERNWRHHDTHPLSGVVITRYGYGAACEYVDILEASHPVPDQAGLEATARLIRFLKDARLTANDLVVCLISGGGSALLVQPVPCLSLAEKAAINSALLKSGAKIQDMNIIRKQISQIKGGGLAALCQPAYLHSLIISDVAGDDLYSIASAPTLPAQHNNADALALIERYSIPIPDALCDYLNQDDAAPKALAIRQNIHVIASAKISLQAAASYAEAQGLTVEIISDSLEGESGAVARLHIEQVTQLKSAPYLLLSGGETTVHVRGTGRGGNNGQFALAALKAANGAENIYGLAADTDGVDGSEDNAGAFFSPELFKAAQAQGLDVDSYIANNDSYGFFEAINGLLVTGPTQTNVNDFRALYVTS